MRCVRCPPRDAFRRHHGIAIFTSPRPTTRGLTGKPTGIMAINSDISLSEAQRQQQLAALDAALPAATRKEKDAPARVLRLEETVSAARARGADDNEIYRLRATAISPAAAARLADVDREEAEWQRRISTYQAQRRQLQQDAAALQQLRDSIFSADEQKRLPAYE